METDMRHALKYDYINNRTHYGQHINCESESLAKHFKRAKNDIIFPNSTFQWVSYSGQKFCRGSLLSEQRTISFIRPFCERANFKVSIF